MERCFPGGIYLFKVNGRNTRPISEICSKLTIETPDQRYWCHSGVFIVNFEHILHFVLVFLLLALNNVSGWVSDNWNILCSLAWWLLKQLFLYSDKARNCIYSRKQMCSARGITDNALSFRYNWTCDLFYPILTFNVWHLCWRHFN